MLLIQELSNKRRLANARVDDIGFDRSKEESKDFNVSISSPRKDSKL